MASKFSDYYLLSHLFPNIKTVFDNHFLSKLCLTQDFNIFKIKINIQAIHNLCKTATLKYFFFLFAKEHLRIQIKYSNKN